MEIDDQISKASISKIITMTLGLPWFEILGELWKIGRKLMRGLSNEGIYEVLEYEVKLELKDRQGKDATIQKREKVRYLQDNIVAYQDQAWGDGKILLNYHCSPGILADQYRLGYKTYILISLREVRNKGDTDEFNIEWNMRNGFLKRKGYWGTAINHRTKRAIVRVIFPKDRPPLNVSVFESNLQRTRTLDRDFQRKLPDGRWMITWENNKPRLYENYVLSWEW